jgi:chaperone required for assembly of F1-ATPase
MFIGLMGVKNDGKTLVTPSNKKICTVPYEWIARIIQRMQHRIARLTHK